MLRGHRGPVSALAWVDDTHLLSGGWDQRLILWAVKAGTPLAEHRLCGMARGVATAPGSQRVAAAAWIQKLDCDSIFLVDLADTVSRTPVAPSSP
jgi:hypothetical protein